jgi:hypothetical protein
VLPRRSSGGVAGMPLFCIRCGRCAAIIGHDDRPVIQRRLAETEQRIASGDRYIAHTARLSLD